MKAVKTEALVELTAGIRRQLARLARHEVAMLLIDVPSEAAAYQGRLELTPPEAARVLWKWPGKPEHTVHPIAIVEGCPGCTRPRGPEESA